MKIATRSLLFVLMYSLLLQGCFLPREEDDPRLEEAATVQASANLSDLDACVSGVWKMDVFALQNKFMDLNVSDSMLIIAPSELTIEFRDDNTFGLYGLMTMRMDMPSGDYMELEGTHSASGTYEANGSVMTFAGVVNEVEFGSMRVYIDGELQEGLFTPNEDGAPLPIAPPVFEFPTSSSYRCTDSQLVLQYSVPTSASVTEEWLRVGE